MRLFPFPVAYAAVFLLSAVMPAQTVVGGPGATSESVPFQGKSIARTPYESFLLPRLQASMRQNSGKKLSTDRSIPLAQTAAGPNFGGFYAAPLWNATPGASVALVIGDFNHDGKPDVANIQTNGEIDVLLNDGSGNLKAPTTAQISTPSSFGSFSLGGAVAADLNGDGFADLVLSVSQSSSRYPILLVLLNQKNGQFGSAIVLPLPNPDLSTLISSFSFAVGATTNSGHVDIVTAELNGTNQATVQSFLNNGSGTFTANTAQSLTFSTSETSSAGAAIALALNDANHDGKQDLLFERNGLSNAGEYVYVLSGNGDGTFQAPGSQATVSFPPAKSIGFAHPTLFAQNLTSNTAKSDLIFSDGVDVDVAMSNGDGTYQAPNQVLQTEGITQIEVADLNKDGKADLVTVGFGVLTSYLGNGDGTFGSIVGAVVSSGDHFNPIHTAIADFNGDGIPDFVSGDSYNGNVEIGFGSGNGTFAATPVLYSTKSPAVPPYAFSAQAEADLNGDGLPDLIAVGPDSILSALANSKGAFTYQAALAYTAYSVRYIEPVSADFNGDGKQDVVFAGWDGTAAVALSNGDGTLKTPVNVINPGVALPCDLGYAAVGDLNGDKNLDLVFPYSGDSSCGQGSAVPSGYFVALGNGDGSFKTPVFYPLGSSIYSVALGYFHGKNNPLDLVINDLGVALNNENVSILQGKGDGTFGPATVVNSGYGISQVLTDDFNQDGNADLTLIAYADYTTPGPGENLLYAGYGDGTFANPVAIDPGFPGISSAGINGVYADVNGDGIPDLITASFYTGLSVNLGTGQGAFAAPINYFFEARGNPVLAGNFLGDNTQSIISFSTNSGGTAFFMNQGGTSLSLSASPSSVTSGQSVTLAATLSPTVAGRPTPGGTITFYDGSTQIGSASAGSASMTTSQLSVGSHSITAAYSGDSNFNPNTSAPVAVTVSALPPDFSFTTSGTTLNVPKGQSANLTMTVAANASLAASVTFQCAGLPSEATCAFSPASLSLPAGSSGTATITIATKAASSNALSRAQIRGITTLGGIAAAGLLFLFCPRRRIGWMLLIVGGLVMVISGGLIGCSGSSSGPTGPKTPSDPGTPTGTTNVTVTATAVAGSTTIQHSVIVAVNVQ